MTFISTQLLTTPPACQKKKPTKKLRISDLLETELGDGLAGLLLHAALSAAGSVVTTEKER